MKYSINLRCVKLNSAINDKEINTVIKKYASSKVKGEAGNRKETAQRHNMSMHLAVMTRPMELIDINFKETIIRVARKVSIDYDFFSM